MKFLQFIFTAVYAIGYMGLGFLFLYLNFLQIAQSWVNLFNPFMYFITLWNMLFMPITWIFLGMSIVGFFASAGVAEMRDEV